jgi:hypothetical protein
MMAERFSRRHGYAPSDAEIIVREDAPEELRGVLVDIAYEAGLSPHGLRSIVCTVLRRREDPNNWTPFPNVDGEARYHVDTCEWYEVYDIIEAIAEDVENPGGFESELNQYFRRRGIGWQLVGGEVQIRGPEAFEQAVSETRQELEAAGRATAAKEIHEALHDLSRRPDPDLTGCIQHSLAALECVARDVVGDPRATLGAILKKHPGLLPRPLDAGAEKLWGFASEQGRHLREGREPGPEDAELVVHVSAALSTYLSRKTEL